MFYFKFLFIVNFFSRVAKVKIKFNYTTTKTQKCNFFRLICSKMMLFSMFFNQKLIFLKRTQAVCDQTACVKN